MQTASVAGHHQTDHIVVPPEDGLRRVSWDRLSPFGASDVLSDRGRGLNIVWTLAEDFNVTERFEGVRTPAPCSAPGNRSRHRNYQGLL